MSVKDDYPAITILADACADKADDGVPEAVRAWREVARLRQWKDEVMAVLAEWDNVHYECAGASAHIGRSKAENVRRELRRLRGQCEVWMNGVADIVEPWGYDRRAASGPADLLPGLTSLAERLRECVEARRYLYEQVVEITAKSPAPGLRDGIRERQSTWPPDSGDTVESRNLPSAPPEVGDHPASSDGSTATRGPAVGTGESPVLARHRVIPQAGSNLCVCGEWFDAEVHQFPESVRSWNVGQDDPHNHYPWTWTPNLPEHGGPVLGSIHTPNGPRPDGGMHAYWGIAHNIWEPSGRLICKLVNRWANDHFGTPIPLADADFGEMGEIQGHSAKHYAPLAPDGNDRRPCTCGQPQTEGVIHRPNGPCFHVSEVADSPSDQVTP